MPTVGFAEDWGKSALQQDEGIHITGVQGTGVFLSTLISLLSAGTEEEAAFSSISFLYFRLIMVCHRYSR